MTRPTHARRAVTLLELLVTVAAAILLTGILLVTIRGVRGQSLVMRDLNNLRMSAQDMLAWSVENDDKFLNIESRESTLYRTFYFFDPSPPDTLFWGYYYSQTYQWNAYLARVRSEFHANWQSAYGLPSPPMGFEHQHAQHQEMWARGDPQVASVLSRLRYTLTLVTKPELWEDAPNAISHDHTHLAEFAKVVRTSDVRFPGGKGLLVNYELDTADTGSHFHAAYTDGSAERRAIAAAVSPAIDPTRFEPVLGRPVLHTKHGYQGRDR